MDALNLTRLFVFSFILSPVSTVAAQSYPHCNDVYQIATRNLQITEFSYDSLNEIYDSYCEASGEVKSESQAVGIDAVIKKIPLKFSGSATENSSKMKNFCMNYSNVRSESFASRVISNTVVVDALKAFNECVNISKRGVIVDHTSPTGLNGAFSFRFDNTVTYELQGVQVGRNLKCTIQDKDTESNEVNVGTSTYKIFEKNFSAFCKRIPIDYGDGREYFPRTSVTFVSNHGAYSVLYPEEEIEIVQFASMIDERLSNVEERVFQTTKNLENKIESLSIATKKSDQNIQNSLNSHINKLDVKVFKVMVGEHHRFAEPNWQTIGCGNIDSWLTSQCPDYHINKTQVFLRGGDRCGYTYYVATCLKK